MEVIKDNTVKVMECGICGSLLKVKYGDFLPYIRNSVQCPCCFHIITLFEYLKA